MIHLLEASIKGTPYKTVTGILTVHARYGVKDIVVLDKNMDTVTKITVDTLLSDTIEIMVPEIERGRLPLSVHGVKRPFIRYSEETISSPAAISTNTLIKADAPVETSVIGLQPQDSDDTQFNIQNQKNKQVNKQKVKRNEIAACAIIFFILFIGTIKSTFIVQEVPVLGQSLVKVFTGLAAFFAFMALKEGFKLTRQQKVLQNLKHTFSYQDSLQKNNPM